MREMGKVERDEARWREGREVERDGGRGAGREEKSESIHYCTTSYTRFLLHFRG